MSWDKRIEGKNIKTLHSLHEWNLWALSPGSKYTITCAMLPMLLILMNKVRPLKNVLGENRRCSYKQPLLSQMTLSEKSSRFMGTGSTTLWRANYFASTDTRIHFTGAKVIFRSDVTVYLGFLLWWQPLVIGRGSHCIAARTPLPQEVRTQMLSIKMVFMPISKYLNTCGWVEGWMDLRVAGRMRNLSRVRWRQSTQRRSSSTSFLLVAVFFRLLLLTVLFVTLRTWTGPISPLRTQSSSNSSTGQRTTTTRRSVREGGRGGGGKLWYFDFPHCRSIIVCRPS